MHELVGLHDDADISGTTLRVRRRLLPWAQVNFRPYPWRGDRNPYRTLITEILLRQTNADRIPHVREKFLGSYPVADSLANATVKDIEAQIAILGFGKQRARQLSVLGHQLVALGNIPHNATDLMSLSGVGFYTANATACFAFGARTPALDVNVARIIARVFGLAPARGELRKNVTIKTLAHALVDGPRPRNLNWGLLDLGAAVCRPNPLCSRCPLSSICDFHLRRGSRTLP